MMKLSLLPFAFVAALSAPLAPTSSSLRTSVTHRPVSRSLVNSRERFALSSRKQTSFKKEEQASIRKQLVTRAQEVQENSSPIPFIAPPVALAAAYALVKLSPLDQALTTFIEGNGYPQMFRDLAMPGFFYNWFHAANMAIVAGAMGGYGAWLGQEGEMKKLGGALNGATKRELHTQLMAGAGLIFAAGGLGGVTFILTLQKSLFESPHAITGFAELMLFATQAGLALSMKQNPGLRQAHATLGHPCCSVTIKEHEFKTENWLTLRSHHNGDPCYPCDTGNQTWTWSIEAYDDEYEQFVSCMHYRSSQRVDSVLLARWGVSMLAC